MPFLRSGILPLTRWVRGMGILPPGIAMRNQYEKNRMIPMARSILDMKMAEPFS